MPSQGLAICGHSAVGKETLIAGLLADEPPGLRGRFGIAGTVRAYGVSDLAPGRFASRSELEHAAEGCILHPPGVPGDPGAAPGGRGGLRSPIDPVPASAENDRGRC